MLKEVLKFSTKSMIIFLLIIIVSGVGHFFIIEPTEVNGRSMEETLNDSEVIVIEKMTLLFSAPERGQIVSVLDEVDKILLVKRIVGLPGEQVIIKDGKVFVIDGSGQTIELDEPYLTEGTITLPSTGKEAIYPTLGEHEYFILGDNRRRSTDSRVSGPVHRSDIIGVVRPLPISKK